MTTTFNFRPTVTSDADTTAGRTLANPTGPAQAFRRGNILGAVSQSSGVPTGAIIERGSNANGRFIRFADGTVIVKGVFLIDLTDSATNKTVATLPTSDFIGPAALSFGATQSVGAYSGDSVANRLAMSSIFGRAGGGIVRVAIIGQSGADTNAEIAYTSVARWF